MDLERASSGLQGLDNVLDGLRLGDNVVWQVDRIEDYKTYTKHFAESALREGRRVVYFRFGRHEAVIPVTPGIQVYHLEAGRGFESFSAEIQELITREGEGVYYIFDSLSDLLSEWSTDLMIGNFFLITCPYLFKLRTIAYFALLRDRHSHQTIARIRDTTQLLLDVFYKERYYIHPLKVWRRYSPTMFLPHTAVGDEFIPLTNSADVMELFSAFPYRGLGNAERKLDYWDHVFINASDLAKRSPAEDPLLAEKKQEVLEELLNMLISRDERILAMARRYLSLEDVLQVKARLIGSGFIGGKAVGLLLARGILAADHSRDWSLLLESHDSFYIGSDVYYTYLVENDYWRLRQEQKKPEHYFSAAAVLRERLTSGTFPEMIREQFFEMLEYFGQAPIIIRSSSLLEDGFGNAFAGKYESVFCVNQGSISRRYEEFTAAVRRVYASTMNEDALVYRLERGLARSDEQMALLVQRVSGSHHGMYYLPDLAGVGLSHNSYIWNREMDPTAGMLRLVYGLGTRAVDRVEDDYARIVPLDRPSSNPISSTEDEINYSQHGIDLLELATNSFTSLSFQELAQQELVPFIPLFAQQVSGFSSGPESRRWVVNFSGLLKQTDFPSVMQEMLRKLQDAYNYPVDTEFTVNFRSESNYNVNLLQCRPLQTRRDRTRVEIPESIPEEQIIFETSGKFMGGSLALRISHIVYVIPQAYTELSISGKYQVARLIGQINRYLGNLNDGPQTRGILLGPGRWGTSTPSLGIPVSFAEINKFTGLGEIAFRTAGFIPEISYGTHFFHDLVELDLFYLAINEDDPKVVFNPEIILSGTNKLERLLPEAGKWTDVVRVFAPSKSEPQILLYADIVEQRVVCWRK